MSTWLILSMLDYLFPIGSTKRNKGKEF